MSNKILYAKQVDEEPIQTIPVANEPRVIIGEYIENNDLQNSIINLDLVNKCWYYSNNVRFIAGFDVVLGIISGMFFNPWLLLTCVIPLCGYQGATQFCTIKTMLYLISCYTIAFSRFLEACELLNYNTGINNPDINNTGINNTDINNPDIIISYDSNTNLSIGVLSIAGMCQFFISIYISMFLCKLYNLNKDEIYVLRSRIKEHNIKESLCC